MNILTLLRMYLILRQLRRHDRWNRRQLEIYQQQALHELRAYACQNSPFYQRFHKGLYDRPLQELPVLTKQTVMAEFDELVTDRAVHLEDARQMHSENQDVFYLGHYRANTTSGSSGVPGIFLFNEQEWATVIASYARGQQWGGVEIGLFRSNKFAFVVSPMAQHMSCRVSNTMRSPWAKMLHLSASDSLDSIVKQLNAWQPEILATYASMARLLAAEQVDGRLHIQPRKIFASAEVLTEEMRSLIEQAWGQPPRNEYAATETAIIAAECEHGHLHLSEDLLIVENVDEQNHPVPPGEFGASLLVTALFNRTQPLIRYQLHDSLQLSNAPCECGRPYVCVECIQGRLEEMLHFLSPEGREVTIHPLMFHQVMDRVSTGAWQIIQRDDGLHVMLMCPDDNALDAGIKQSIHNVLERSGVGKSTIYVEHIPVIPRSAGGKLLLIKSETNRTGRSIVANA